MQYKVIAYVVCDKPNGLDDFPHAVILSTRRAILQYEQSSNKLERDLFDTANRLINLYLDTQHMRYILMLYMMIQEIQEIETGSQDDIGDTELAKYWREKFIELLHNRKS